MSSLERAPRQPVGSKLRPTRRLLNAAAAWLLLGLALRFVPALTPAWPLWPAAGGMLAALALIDAWRLWRERPELKIERRLPATWPLNAAVRVETTVSHRAGRKLSLLVHDLFPQICRAEHLPQRIDLAPGQTATIGWQATATRRGAFRLDACHIARRSPVGLWWLRESVSAPTSFRVYPDFNLVSRYGLLAGAHRLEDMGIHLDRRRGAGSEFEQLREYREGDSLRQIDWSATARTRKLISREYQAERNQSLVFVLDTGHRMQALDGELSHFDHGLNAMLLLAHVALKQGDEVGLQTAGDARDRARVLPPARGQRQYAALLESTFDLQPGSAYPDFAAAASRFLDRQRRRSLVIVLTNLRDSDHSELLRALGRIRQRHLVILADLRERVTDASPTRRRQSSASEFSHALLESAASLYREQRKTATARLRQRGIIHLDVLPDELPAALVSQYQRLKSEGML